MEKSFHIPDENVSLTVQALMVFLVMSRKVMVDDVAVLHVFLLLA